MNEIERIASKLAAKHDVPVAHVHAVIEVESGGTAFTTVKNRFGTKIRFPLCRFEGHLFYRALSGAKLQAAVDAGLARKKALAVANPKTQQGRYDLWDRACSIDAEAATASCSWGVGQVLGMHAKRFRMSSSADVYSKAGTLEGQIGLVFDYCAAFGLLDELREGHWSAFAEGYNGPNYRVNRYDEKLAAAAKRFGGVAAVPDGMLRMGAKGPRVRELQTLLGRAGAPVKIDGSFGQTTRAALKKFQAAAGIDVDGAAGPETMEKLSAYHAGEQEDLQKVGVAGLLQIPKIGTAGTAAGGAVVIAEAKSSIEGLASQAGDLASQISGFGDLAHYAEMAASGLVTVAGVLGVAAAVYAGWHWVRSHRNYEGVAA